MTVQVPSSDCEVAGRGQSNAEAAVGLPEVGRHGCEALCCCRDNAKRLENSEHMLCTVFCCVFYLKYENVAMCFIFHQRNNGDRHHHN